MKHYKNVIKHLSRTKAIWYTLHVDLLFSGQMSREVFRPFDTISPIFQNAQNSPFLYLLETPCSRFSRHKSPTCR